MPLEDEDMIFNGSSNAEAERFLTWVRRKGRAEGKLRDNDWMVELASSSLSGDALRWYLGLDGAIQDSWSLLQSSILHNWSGAGATASAITPTPAAAPEPSVMRPALSATRTGRIRVFGAPEDTYLSRHIDGNGIFNACKGRPDALQVRFTPSEGPHGIELLNSSAPYRWLGAWLREAETSQIKQTDFLAMTATSPPGQSPILWSGSSDGGKVQSAIWNVSPFPDETIRISWENGRSDGGTFIFPDVAFCEKQKWALPVLSLKAFLSPGKVAKYTEARLVFEPL